MGSIKKPVVKDFLPFLPLLILYIVLVLVFSPDHLFDDEPRHMAYATNLSNGFYADSENPSLRNGPGYPLFITLPVLFNASHDAIRLLNAPLLIMAIVFLFKSLSFFLQRKKAIMLCYLLGLYPIALKSMLGILSESLALFLICGFIYYFIKLHRQGSERSKNLILSAIFLGLLALTKVIFGYVILTGILGCLIVYLFKKSKKVQSSILVLVLSFMFCIPYLGYTYTVTGKAFVWGTQGGEMLYWRSTPFENEMGNWIGIDNVLSNSELKNYEQNQTYKNHGPFLKSVAHLSYLERDVRFKEKAIENIKKYPSKFIKNTFASAFRLFFNYPYSETPQKLSTYFYMLPNMFLFVLLVLASYLAFKNTNSVSFEIVFLILMALIFMGGLTLLDGRVRHLLPIIPVLLIFIAYSFEHFVTLKAADKKTLQR